MWKQRVALEHDAEATPGRCNFEQVVAFEVVVLPQPDGPRKETNSPFPTVRLNASTAMV
jgi:hypothetical protein